MEAIVYGYGLVEGPRLDDAGNLFFSDVFGGGVYRRSPDGDVQCVVPKRRGVGGLLLHADGGVVASGRDVVHCHDGETRTLFARDGVTGFNDITADADGRVLAGSLRYNMFAGDDPVPGEIWRIDRDGEAARAGTGVLWANGLGVSADGGRLYASDYARAEVLLFDLTAAAPTNGETFARSPRGSVDGLALDSEGGVWVALGTGGGVARLDADGHADEILDVPASFVSSLCFAGADGRDLYIATADNTEDPSKGGTIFRTRAEVAGLPVPRATI